MQPTTRYAKSGEFHIAYQVFGSGPDLVMTQDSFPILRITGTSLAWPGGLITSDPSVASRCSTSAGRVFPTGLRNLPTIDERMDDLRAVMDAADITRAAQFGISEGGSLAVFFAATHPERVASLILYGAFARIQAVDTNR